MISPPPREPAWRGRALSPTPRGLAPREGLELVLMKIGHAGTPLEPRRGPQVGKSGDPRTQNTDNLINKLRLDMRVLDAGVKKMKQDTEVTMKELEILQTEICATWIRPIDYSSNGVKLMRVHDVSAVFAQCM